MRKRYALIGAALAATAAAIVFQAYGRTGSDEPAQSQAASQTASLAVSVETVRAEEMPSKIIATGSVTAWQEATISAESSGLQLIEVLVAEGDRVTESGILARLDSALLKAQLAEQEAAIEQARATLEAAEAAAARAEKLRASNAISAETAEERATTVKTSKAQLAQSEAAAERIRVEIGQTEIRAPFDGIVSSKPAVIGSIVQMGTELMAVIRDGRLEVAVQVPDKDLATIEPGQTAMVAGPSGETIEGSISSVSQKVDQSTRLGTVRVALGEDSNLKPGMFARVTIETSNRSTLTIAERALVWRGGKPNVFVVEDEGKISARIIETGGRENGRVAVTSGLAEGETIVVSGAGFLSDGNLVRVSKGGDDAAAIASSE